MLRYTLELVSAFHDDCCGYTVCMCKDTSQERMWTQALSFTKQYGKRVPEIEAGRQADDHAIQNLTKHIDLRLHGKLTTYVKNFAFTASRCCRSQRTYA